MPCASTPRMMQIAKDYCDDEGAYGAAESIRQVARQRDALLNALKPFAAAYGETKTKLPDHAVITRPCLSEPAAPGLLVRNLRHAAEVIEDINLPRAGITESAWEILAKQRGAELIRAAIAREGLLKALTPLANALNLIETQEWPEAALARDKPDDYPVQPLLCLGDLRRAAALIGLTENSNLCRKHFAEKGQEVAPLHEQSGTNGEQNGSKP